MTVASDFKVFQTQATIFTRVIFRGGKVLAHFITRYAEHFSGEPVSMPMLPGTEGVPPEVPRIILKSEDSSLRLQVSPARVDLVKSGDLSEQSVQEFLTFATDLFEGYGKETQAEIGRLAFLVHRQAAMQHPARVIAEHFCKDQWLQDPLKRPSDFELHAAKQFEMGRFVTVNSWFRCQSARLKMKTAPEPQEVAAIVIVQDFNTLKEESQERAYSPDEIRRFFSLCLDESRTVLNRYFPPAGK